MAKFDSKKTSLAMGTIGAVLAAGCCLGPLLLVMLGVSGAWIGNLSALEPYRPVFIGIALIAMFIAWHQIFRAQDNCNPKTICAAPKPRFVYKLGFWMMSLLVLIALIFPYILPLFY